MIITRKIAVQFSIIKTEYYPHLKRWTVTMDIGSVARGEIRRGIHIAGTPTDRVADIAEAAVSAMLKADNASFAV